MKTFSKLMGLIFLVYAAYSFIVAFEFQRIYMATVGATFWDMPNNAIQYVAEKTATPFGFSMVFFILPHMGRLPSKRDQTL